mmetsp:Transcript_2376/g.5882  ORF Transcript_2376/g.5882 Transcript_2376/m.5882 type:complete len:420 (+) Transcript_2376:225-1484(+)
MAHAQQTGCVLAICNNGHKTAGSVCLEAAAHSLGSGLKLNIIHAVISPTGHKRVGDPEHLRHLCGMARVLSNTLPLAGGAVLSPQAHHSVGVSRGQQPVGSHLDGGVARPLLQLPHHGAALNIQGGAFCYPHCPQDDGAVVSGADDHCAARGVEGRHPLHRLDGDGVSAGQAYLHLRSVHLPDEHGGVVPVRSGSNVGAAGVESKDTGGTLMSSQGVQLHRVSAGHIVHDDSALIGADSQQLVVRREGDHTLGLGACGVVGVQQVGGRPGACRGVAAIQAQAAVVSSGCQLSEKGVDSDAAYGMLDSGVDRQSALHLIQLGGQLPEVRGALQHDDGPSKRGGGQRGVLAERVKQRRVTMCLLRPRHQARFGHHVENQTRLCQGEQWFVCGGIQPAVEVPQCNGVCHRFLTGGHDVAAVR